MPYASNAALPRRVQSHLPKQAQDIYREAFNHAWEFYREPRRKTCNKKGEERARSVAWYAVEEKYKRTNSGEWVES